MERDRLVKRRKGKEDGRQTFVSLTRKGRELEEKAKEIPGCLSECIADKGVAHAQLMPLFNPLDSLINALCQG